MPGQTTTQAPTPRTTVGGGDRAAAGGSRGRPEPRQLSILRAGDVLAIFGALAASLALTALLWTEVAPFTGILGYVVVSWFLFVIFYAVLISFDENRPTVRDRVSAVVVQSLGLLVLAALAFVIIYTFFDVRTALAHANFFTHDMRLNIPGDPLTKRGMVHAALGTLVEVGLAMVMAVPLGLAAAGVRAGAPGRFARFVRMISQAETPPPGVVAGRVVYAPLLPV